MTHTAETLKAAYLIHNTKDVPFNIFASRVRNLGWILVRAGSTVYTPRSARLTKSKQLYEGIETPSVGFDTFCSRLRHHKDPEEAAKQPLFQPGELRTYFDQHPKPAVDYRTFYFRVRHNKWSREKAIETVLEKTAPKAPRQRSTFLARWFDSNKHRATVDWDKFSTRVKKLGWDKEKALTQDTTANEPLKLREFYSSYPNPKVVYTTFYNRVNIWKWSKEEAISTPPKSHLDSVTHYPSRSATA